MTLKIFRKRNNTWIGKCPYCGGLLQTTFHYIWDYDCLKCDRSWKVFGERWTALFDAERTVVDKGVLS